MTTTSGTAGQPARTIGQLWQVPAFLIGAVALALVAAAAPLAPRGDDKPLEQDLLAIRQALKKPGAPTPEIVMLAESTVAQARQQEDRTAEAHFLLGAVYLRLADAQTTPETIRAERDRANMHLELAELKGVPESDVGRLTYLRGKLAFLLTGNMPRAVDLLSKSLPGGSDNPTEGYGMLVQAYLHGAPVDIDAALAANLKQMEYCDDYIIMCQAQLLRGELLLKKGLRAEAIRWWESIGAKAPQAIRLRARLLQASAAMEEGMWGQAIAWWTELLPHPEIIPGGKGRLLYQIGCCNAHFEPPGHEKEAIAAWRECQLYGGEESQAAALKLAELRLYGGGDPDVALAHFKEALEKIATPQEYKNSVIDLGKVRELLEEACRVFEERKDNNHFLQAAELYKKIAAPGAAEERIGEAAMAQGMELVKLKQPERARTPLQQAALAFQKAAEFRTPAASIDALWRAIECYRAAQMPVEAVAVLKKFVDLPTTNDRKAEAWFTLAEIQRGLNLPEAAVSYKHCVAFNNPNFHSRALLELAGLAIAQQNLDEAQALLVSIKMAPPFPDRASHQTALIKLANLYFQRKQFEKAALECKEIINQYANENQYVVREQLGECYLKIAWQAFENFSGAQDEITAPKKQHYMKEWQSHLDLARVVFQEIAEELDAKAQDWQLPPNGRPLPPQEERLRRDAHFKVVDCCLELQGSLHDAFLRSHRLYEQFREDREGLWACQRLCQCLTKALATNRDDIALYIEAADDAVQYCLNHLDKYDAVGAFRSLDERERFNDWLKNMHSYLNSIKRRGG